MKLKVGDAVEILRSELSEAWFPARIVSVDKNKVLVRFDYKQHQIEKVPAEDVRPRPPSLEKKKRWALGDVVEVFDCHSWRPGKVVKVLLDNKYVVKVFSSIMLKEFHGSCLRTRLTWHNDQWMRKDSMYSHINFDAASGNEVTHRGNQCGQHDKKYLGGLPPLKPLKRNNFSADISGIDAVEGISKKRKEMIERKKKGLSVKDLPKQINEERNECSIASCGSNYLLECTVQDFRTSSRVPTDSVFNDASSSCPAKTGNPISHVEDEELAANVHKLELQAYRSTVQALYASGPLSWEQESLLTNLRLSLNISNEEHLLQLRQLLSAPVF